MADESNPIINVNAIPKSIDNAIQNLTDSPSKQAGTTFGDIWFLVFGGVSQAAEKRRLEYAKDLEIFKDEINSQIKNIPTENLISPDMQIVAPALENAKFCVSKEDLRKMFAKLISSSMDISKQDIVHPAFGEIIKQMSIIDADNLQLFKNALEYPLCRYRIHETAGTNKLHPEPIFISNPKIQDITIQARSIQSLCRLGLVEIKEIQLADSKFYELFDNTQVYLGLQWTVENNTNYTCVEIEKLKVSRTAFGSAFISTCIGTTFP